MRERKYYDPKIIELINSKYFTIPLTQRQIILDKAIKQSTKDYKKAYFDLKEMLEKTFDPETRNQYIHALNVLTGFQFIERK